MTRNHRPPRRRPPRNTSPIPLDVLAEALGDYDANGFDVRRCRFCGCTDDDCHRCIERTGSPCSWVEADLCSACVGREAVFNDVMELFSDLAAAIEPRDRGAQSFADELEWCLAELRKSYAGAEVDHP